MEWTGEFKKATLKVPAGRRAAEATHTTDHPKPENPKSKTPNPKTLNPNPKTLNPKP